MTLTEWSIVPPLHHRTPHVPWESKTKDHLCSSATTFESTVTDPVFPIFHTTNVNMVQSLDKKEIDSQTDPSVSKQYDSETPTQKQLEDFYTFADKQKVGLLTTVRQGLGPVSRSMAIAKRVGPDFLFLANKHSNKFDDIENDKTAQITFQNSSSQDWASLTGTVTTAANDDPRIKELWNRGTSAWFGDLGDGVHDGTADDPRMSLIEVKAKYICYWKSQVGTLGFLKEVGVAAATGGVADTGVQRELKEDTLEQARKMETK